MTMLVSLAQAKEHCRVDSDDGDTDLELKVKAASAAVITYLGAQASTVLELDSNGDPDEDSSGDPIGVPHNVQIAVLMLTGIFYRDREGQDTGRWQPGYLPAPVTAMLWPLRDPALA